MTRYHKIFLFILFLFLPLIAKAETLNLVTALDPLEAREYVSAFEKDTGIKVNWIRLSAGEALARLKSESKNPTQDVWFGAPSTEFVAAKRSALLSPYVSKETNAIDKKWRDKDGYWTGVYFGAIVFITHDGITPPTSWQDLLKPEYKGEIVVSYPYTAGTGYTVLAGLVAMQGEDNAISYYEKLDKQIRRYTKSGGAPIVEVGLGEANVGIVFDQDALRKGVSRGFPLQLTYPTDGVPYEIGGVATIKGGNEKLAGKFIDWITSLEGQDLMQKWFRVPLLSKAQLNVKSKNPRELNLAKIDIEKAGNSREELINKWREKIGK